MLLTQNLLASEEDAVDFDKDLEKKNQGALISNIEPKKYRRQ